MKKIAAIGALLMIGGGLVGGAAPVQAQPTPPPVLNCGGTIGPVCSAVGRQLQNVQEEIGHVPGYIQHAYDELYDLYQTADATVRCVVFKDCA